MQRFLVWSIISSPPTLLILLSLKPQEIISLRLYGFLTVVLLATLISLPMAIPALRSQTHFRQQMAVSLVMVISIILFNWPLRIAYNFSRPAFDRVAKQVMLGEAITTPQRVGWFHIEQIDGPSAGYQVPCLWTEVHPNGNTGFVQASPDNLRFNLWSHFRLDETWQFIAED